VPVLLVRRPSVERPETSQRWRGVRCGLGRGGFHREGSANIRSRLDHEAPIGRPRGIGRVLLDKKSWGATVDWYSEEVRVAVIVRRRGDRPAIGCPCGSTLRVERIGHNPCVGAIGQHHVQERLPGLPD
jgi:hypothetical protein